jgi:hypothetical protein
MKNELNTCFQQNSKKNRYGLIQSRNWVCLVFTCLKVIIEKKMSLILVSNKNLPQSHTESELGMLDVHGKLVKYVVHSSKRKN